MLGMGIVAMRKLTFAREWKEDSMVYAVIAVSSKRNTHCLERDSRGVRWVVVKLVLVQFDKLAGKLCNYDNMLLERGFD